MELDFNDILSGKEAKPTVTEQPKSKPSDVKARQQSCMIHEIDKDLVPQISFSYPLIPKRPFRISESVSPICLILYFNSNKGQK